MWEVKGLSYFRTPAGEPVAECELAAGDIDLLPTLTEVAAREGAELLWVHCPADLHDAGFTAQQGYRRFTGEISTADESLPAVGTEAVLELLPRLFIGQWGHHLITDPDMAWLTSPEATYVGLCEGDAWIGLSRVEPARRHVDGPGILPDWRTPAAIRQLTLGAFACLGPGPVTVETWGESPDPYLAIGLQVAEEDGGWERVLSR
jgi:hypothetical protein